MAGTKCLDGQDGPDCAREAGDGSHPGHPQNSDEFEDMVLNYAIGAQLIGSGLAPGGIINGPGNPWGANYSPYDEDADDQNNYLTIFTGKLWLETAGDYRFIVDGDEAVEVLVDGRVRTGWYGEHDACNCSSHRSRARYYDAGEHTIEFRHEEGTGADSYLLKWEGPSIILGGEVIPANDSDHPGSPGLYELVQTTYSLTTPPTPASVMNDFLVKVVVADPSVGVEDNCEQYPAGNYKPIGLLQKYGQPGKCASASLRVHSPRICRGASCERGSAPSATRSTQVPDSLLFLREAILSIPLIA